MIGCEGSAVPLLVKSKELFDRGNGQLRVHLEVDNFKVSCPGR